VEGEGKKSKGCVSRGFFFLTFPNVIFSIFAGNTFDNKIWPCAARHEFFITSVSPFPFLTPSGFSAFGPENIELVIANNRLCRVFSSCKMYFFFF